MQKLLRDDFMEGQTVYLLHCNGMTHLDKIDDYIREATVISIKRKYLTVACFGKIVFDMENNFQEKSEYSPTWMLFLGKQCIYDYLTQRQLANIVRHKVTDYIQQVSLEDLQQIESIMDKYIKT